MELSVQLEAYYIYHLDALKHSVETRINAFCSVIKKCCNMGEETCHIPSAV